MTLENIIEKQFNAKFYEGQGNGVYCKKHKFLATPIEIKSLLRSSYSELLGEVVEEICKKQQERDKSSRSESQFNDRQKIFGENISIIKSKLPKEDSIN